MRLVARWGVVVVVSAAGFALTWWVCQALIGLDEGVSLGVAGAVLAVLLAVAAWWAPREARSGGADGAGQLKHAAPAPVREETGAVENTISGGTFSGPVLQGRDFTGQMFGTSPSPPAVPPSRPRDPGAG